MRQKLIKYGLSVLLMLILLIPDTTFASRIKDISTIEGVRKNQLIGYGLVVGLNGTGDKSSTNFTTQSIINMLERLNVHVDSGTIQVKNVAAVVVTADLNAFARVGSKLDILVSSLGDATSLAGGTLLLTPLKGVDGRVYALAQGPLLVGGFSVQGQAGATAKNHPTVGRIPHGATVEEEIQYDLNDLTEIVIALDKPDFVTATRMVKTINAHLGGNYAHALDSGTVNLAVPTDSHGDIVSFLAGVQTLPIEPDTVAKVVIDERTGTIVMGDQVRISKVAVAHGNISIQVKETQDVSQPMPFSGGETVISKETDIQVQEEERKLVVLDAGVTIGSLVRALNAIGATPRDLISILQSLKASGALRAQLDII